MTFDFYSYRFQFTARDAIRFPPGKPGNVLRAAFGSALRRTSGSYGRIFEPVTPGDGPSGLADWPRPFVFRCSHLDGATIQSGDSFWFNMNLFDVRNPVIDDFERAFREMASAGLGPQRGRAGLESIEQLDREGHARAGPPISIRLDEAPKDVQRIAIEFRTPTELKGAAKPEFAVLFARARDRVSTLRALYGEGSLDIDFQSIGQRAAAVLMTRCELRHVSASRRSGRTGQVHNIGGFVGVAEYEGSVGEFLPYLEAARWTGVGRHCVWGLGEISLHCIL